MSYIGPHQRPALDKADWTRKAIGLHIRGWSIRRIAEKVGKSKTVVADAISSEFTRLKVSEEELLARRAVLLEKLERRESKLNRLTRKYLSTAMGGDLDAAKVVIEADKALDRVHQSIAKLEGLNAKEQIDLSGSVALTATAHDELLNRLARLTSEGEEGSDSSEPDA